MLLTISTTHSPADELGYLLHKHPEKFQSFDLSFGKAHVFYPEVGFERTTAALLLDVDPVGLVRGKAKDSSFTLGSYVNDRPYVCSSFMSVAIAQVFRSAMAGQCKDRPALAETMLPLTARLEGLPVRGDAGLMKRLFEPLGYAVESVRHPLDEQFPDWGESAYHSVAITGVKRLAELLTHLYVLIPVFDNAKHYFVGDDELEKLVAHGAGWLATHPDKELIARRYLKHRSSLYREALARLIEEEANDDASDETAPIHQREEIFEETLRLNDQRHGVVLAALRASGARSVLDLGCGDGKFLRRLIDDRQFERIVGVDVSVDMLQRAGRRVGYETMSAKQRERIELTHGSLTYRDRRLSGFDAAAAIEVIEHLDPCRLPAFERVLFEFAAPRFVALSTPNREYNVAWESLPAGQFRHADHRFEWSRNEFHEWATRAAERFGYAVRFLAVGTEVDGLEAPTQLALFEKSIDSGTADIASDRNLNE